MKRTCLLVLVSCLVLSSITSAALLTDDTWVREDSPDSNRNGNDQVNARTDVDNDDNDVIMLKFDVSGDGAALNSSLNLVWYRDDSSDDKTLSLYGLNETHSAEASWAEDVITYNTCPGLIPDGQDPTAETGLSHSWDDIRDLDMANLTLLVDSQLYGPQVTDQVYSFSSAALDAFINADTNGYVTLLIVRGQASTSSNQARFQVKETGTGASLVVPEPMSMALLGLGGLIALRKRR